MKIRNLLVSNSSSSSFIYYGKLDKVAKQMLQVVMNDSKENCCDSAEQQQLMKNHHKQLKKNLFEALSKSDVQDGTSGICFRCCNGYTCIVKIDEKVYIDTTWNHDWDFSIDGLNHVADENEVGDLQNGYDFYYLDGESPILASKDVYNFLIKKYRECDPEIEIPSQFAELDCPICADDANLSYRSFMKGADGQYYCESHLIPLVKKT